MNASVKNELRNYILDCINEGTLTNENKDDWHFHAFNEDYYITYHSEGFRWLKKHDIDGFTAINEVRDYETDHFGEFTTEVSRQAIVNMLVYIYGEELINSYDAETVEELETQIINELLNVEIVKKVGTEIYSTEKDFVFFNVVNKTEVSNYILTNDLPRYKNKYDKFLSTEQIKNI